jgi:haloalkane dehalogenase
MRDVAEWAPAYVDLEHAEVAYRKIGRGEPLLMVHGYPLSGLTFRHLVRRLAENFTCYLPDLPGLGETRWTDRTAFDFAAQARTLKQLVDHLGLTSYSVLAHDTGGTIARRLTVMDIGRVKKLILLGTEIPNHRPPWIELYQRRSDPARTGGLRFLMGLRTFRRSGACFGGCFHDLGLLDGEFHRLFVEPLLDSKYRLSGMIRYLQGIDWALVDGMKTEHAEITIPTLLIWGEDDPVFPVNEARAIADQLPACEGFVTVPGAKLFVHEEKPAEVARVAREFLVRGRSR